MLASPFFSLSFRKAACHQQRGDSDLLQSVTLSGGGPLCLPRRDGYLCGHTALSVDLCGRTEGGNSRGEAELGARGCGRVGKAGEGRPG